MRNIVESVVCPASSDLITTRNIMEAGITISTRRGMVRICGPGKEKERWG